MNRERGKAHTTIYLCHGDEFGEHKQGWYLANLTEREGVELIRWGSCSGGLGFRRAMSRGRDFANLTGRVVLIVIHMYCSLER